MRNEGKLAAGFLASLLASAAGVFGIQSDSKQSRAQNERKRESETGLSPSQCIGIVVEERTRP
jgi:hypothetical protein